MSKRLLTTLYSCRSYLPQGWPNRRCALHGHVGERNCFRFLQDSWKALQVLRGQRRGHPRMGRGSSPDVSGFVIPSLSLFNWVSSLPGPWVNAPSWCARRTMPTAVEVILALSRPTPSLPSTSNCWESSNLIANSIYTTYNVPWGLLALSRTIYKQFL